MSFENFIALLGFATVATVTPGPNNVMAMTSGANFGFLRTVPHMLGIAFGFAFMLLLVGLGLGQAFGTLPWLRPALAVLGTGYLLWLAWKIAHAAAPGSGADEAARPLTFLQAAGFQWVNPKAWQMAVSGVTLYAADAGVLSVSILAGVFFAVCFPCVSLWTLLGLRIRHMLKDQRRLRLFNWTMAGLLVASLALLI